MSAIATAINRLFADPNLSMSATYAPTGGGDARELRVMRVAGDAATRFSDARFVSDATLIDVRASDVDRPVVGDTVTIEGVSYRVTADALRDDRRLIWTIELVEI